MLPCTSIVLTGEGLGDALSLSVQGVKAFKEECYTIHALSSQ